MTLRFTKHIIPFIGLLTLSLLVSTPLKAQDPFKRLKYLEATTTDPYEKADIYILSAFLHMGQEPSMYKQHIQKAYALSDSLNYNEGLCNTLNTMGIYEAMKANFTQAITHFKNQEKTALKDKNLTYVGLSALNTGECYSTMGHLDSALIYHYRALEAYEHLKDSLGMAAIFDNIAMIYLQMESYHKAQIFLEKAEPLVSKKSAYDHDLINHHLCQAQLFIKTKSFDLANFHLEEGKESTSFFEDKQNFLHFLKGKGDFFLATENYDKALSFYDRFLGAAIQGGFNAFVVKAQLALGETYYQIGQPQEAIKHLSLCLEQARKQKQLIEEIKCLNLLGQVHKEIGDYQQAYEYMEAFGKKYLSHLHILIEENVSKAEWDYKYKKNLKNWEDNFENYQELQEHKLQKQTHFGKFLTWLSAVLILCLLLLLGRHITKIQANKSLKTTQKAITKAREEAEEEVRHKRQLITIIGHDLKNYLGLISSVSAFLAEQTSHETPKEFGKFLTSIEKNADKGLELLDHLILWGKNQMGLQTFTPNITNITYLIQKEVNLALPRAEAKGATLSFEPSSLAPISAYCDEAMVRVTIRNILSNAIKFSPKKEGKIFIHTQQNGNYFIINVKDNGIGMNVQEVEMALQNNPKIIRKGTNKEKGYGLGLTIAKSYIEKHQGELKIKSRPNEGTTIIITIPIKREGSN